MTMKVKSIKGHGLGTNMEWLCVVHKDESFGFGKEPAITCVDMTVHAPERDRPSVNLSEYMANAGHVRMFPNAYKSPEQVAFAKYIKKNWDTLKSGDTIDVDQFVERD